MNKTVEERAWELLVVLSPGYLADWTRMGPDGYEPSDGCDQAIARAFVIAERFEELLQVRQRAAGAVKTPRYMFLRLWTKAVDTSEYNKDEWKELEALLFGEASLGEVP